MDNHFNILSNNAMWNYVTTLWDFQNQRAVHQLLIEVELTGDWSYVFNNNKASYKWILN